MGLCDDVGYGECFAGAGHAEECLVFVAGVDAVDELLDGGGLVASGLVWGDELELGHYSRLALWALRSYILRVWR